MAGRRLAFVVCCSVFVVGCSLTFPAQKHLVTATPAENSELLDCKDHRGALAITKEVTSETSAYSVEEFVFTFRNTGSKKNDSVAGEFWRSKNSNGENRRLAVLAPGTGDRVSTEGSSKPLVAKGFDVVRFFSGIDIFDKQRVLKKETITEAELRLFAKAGGNVIRLRACDYLFVINYFDKPPHGSIGISGVSLGGIFTPIIDGADPKISGVLPMISGGNIAEILHTSQEKDIAEIRNMVRKRFVGNEAQIARALVRKHWGVGFANLALYPSLGRLRHAIQSMIQKEFAKKEFTEKEKLLWKVLAEELWNIDPLRFAPSLDPSKVRIVANYWDYVIRYEFARQLWEASGRPDFEVILFPPGHYGSALLLWIPMIRYELRCLIKPFCVPVPWSVGRVPEINKQFFDEKLPR